MNLLLWRHGAADESEDPSADLARGLNARGRKQVAQVAAWLQARLPAEVSVFAGPALRTQQTAAAFTSAFRVIDMLVPAAAPEQILTNVGWPDHRGTVIVVGHQPALGRLAAYLLFGAETEVSIKKGAVWWIANRDREDRAQNVLRAVATPDLVIASGEGRIMTPDRQITYA